MYVRNDRLDKSGFYNTSADIGGELESRWTQLVTDYCICRELGAPRAHTLSGDQASTSIVDGE